MKRLNTLLLILAMGTSAFVSGNAVAHPKVTKTEPAVGAVLDTAPKIIQVTFNEPLEPAFSTIRLARVDGDAVVTEAAKVDPAEPKVLVLRIPALTAGDYQAHYAVVGHDGHRREGDIKFSVK